MNPRTFGASALRIIQQLTTDRRTLGLILAVPLVLVTLLYYVYRDVPVPPGGQDPFPRIALIMLGILPMLVMFAVTSVAMLRERTSGTLERLWTTPLHRADLVGGYALAFAGMAVLQSLLLSAVTYWFLGVTTEGSAGWVVLVAALSSTVGIAFGLLASAFARTEFQAVQFMPVFIAPQIFLCGLLVDTDLMPEALQWLSDFMPMTYAVDALMQIRDSASMGSDFTGDALMLAAMALGALLLAALTMPRSAR